MALERWKPIAGYDGYEVSDKGRVRHRERVLKPGYKETGYPQVCLCKDASQRVRTIHRLVAEAFIPNPDGLREVDHINQDKTDNRLENLRWVTRSENMRNVTYRPGRSGELYITVVRGRYRVRICNATKRVSRYFDELADAVAFRNEVMA